MFFVKKENGKHFRCLPFSPLLLFVFDLLGQNILQGDD